MLSTVISVNVVGAQPPYGLAVYAAFLTEHIGAAALFLHGFPQFIKYYHVEPPALTFDIMGVIISTNKGI